MLICHLIGLTVCWYPITDFWKKYTVGESLLSKTKQGSNQDFPIKRSVISRGLLPVCSDIEKIDGRRLWVQNNQLRSKCSVTLFTVADEETRRHIIQRNEFIQETNKLTTEFFNNIYRQYNKLAARHREEQRQLLNSNRQENRSCWTKR